MKPEDQEDEWIDVGTYPTLDEAHERALVALAMGESVRVENGDQPGEFDLQAEPDAVIKISEEIRQYEAESKIIGKSKIVPSNWARYPAGWGYYMIWAAVLLVVFHLQQTDLSLVERGKSSSIDLIEKGEWWRPFTALFLHADLGHLLGNLASGALFAMLVSKSIGSLKAWAMILLSGTVGNLITSLLTYPESFTSIGASTAVFGALGILSGVGLVENLREKVSMPWVRVLAPLLAGFVLLGWLGGAAPGSQTDVFGHVFGFSAGVVGGMICRYFVTSETLQESQKKSS
ncbi:MAG: rhomboid family intramembrane serine protease [Verrucomicrobiota bacterium]